MSRTLSIAVVATIIFCVVSGAVAEGVNLQYKFRQGEVDRYRLMMEMTMPGMATGSQGPMTIKMSTVFTQKTLGVLPDGSARIRMSFGDFSVNTPGLPNPPKVKGQQIPPVVFTLTKDGAITGLGGSEAWAAATSMPGMDYNQLFGQTEMLPTWPVSVGDSWRLRVPIPSTTGGITIVSELLSTGTTVNGVPAAKIVQDYEAKINLGDIMKSMAASFRAQGMDMPAVPAITGSMDMSGWGVLYFSPDRGKLLKATKDLTASIRMRSPTQGVRSGPTPRMEMEFVMGMKLSVTKV